MPCTDWYYSCRSDDRPRVAAWAAHMVAKGCHPLTAQTKAQARCWRKAGWPPC